MKIITASNGKQTVKMSKNEWTAIGKKAGWMKVAQGIQEELVTDWSNDPEKEEHYYNELMHKLVIFSKTLTPEEQDYFVDITKCLRIHRDEIIKSIQKSPRRESLDIHRRESLGSPRRDNV